MEDYVGDYCVVFWDAALEERKKPLGKPLSVKTRRSSRATTKMTSFGKDVCATDLVSDGEPSFDLTWLLASFSDDSCAWPSDWAERGW